MKRRSTNRRSTWVALLFVLGAFSATYLGFVSQWGYAPERTPAGAGETGAASAAILARPDHAPPSAEVSFIQPALVEYTMEFAPRSDAAGGGGSALGGAPLTEHPVGSEAADSADAITQAREMLEHGDALGALDRLRAIPFEQLNPAGLAVTGCAHLELGDHETARLHLERAAVADPDCAMVWSALARAHRRAGDARLAYRAAHRALRVGLEAPRAWTELGLALLDLQRADEALDALEEAVVLDGCDHEAWNAIGLIHLQREDFTPARDALERAAAAAGSPAHVHNNLAVVYERLGYMEWADREYGRCLEQDPTHPTAALSRRRIAPFLAVRSTDR
ncbi:MAG: tetratricopeptide repeat protein [Candidatus Eisenbacteria bacterium]